MSHAFRVASGSATGTKSDTEREQLKRDQEQLLQLVANKRGVLAGRCLKEDQLLALYAWSCWLQKQPGWRGKPPPGFDRPELVRAAEIVLEAVQAELHQREGEGPLEPGVAFELDEARACAQLVLRRYLGRGQSASRELEARAGGGTARTICMGSTISVKVEELERGEVVERTIRTFAGGCFRVCPETTRLDGGRRVLWCDACAPSKGQARRAWKVEIRDRYRELLERQLARRAVHEA